jgi:hypothetical protein
VSRRRGRRAVIVITRDVAVDKQWRAVLERCATEGMVVEALTRDPWAAIALIEAGFADVAVAATCDEHKVLLHTALPVLLLRQSPHRESTAITLIRDMLGRGGTPEVVAQLLGVPLREVEAVAGGQPRKHQRFDPELRPRHVGDPAAALRSAR